MPEGTANDIGPRFWEILSDSGNQMARFDHGRFSDIRNGARVRFSDVDANGIAQNVQPASAVARYVARNAQAGAPGSAARTRLHGLIMDALGAAATEKGSVRQNRLRRLRAAIDRL